jgi:hypothetical protein
MIQAFADVSFDFRELGGQFWLHHPRLHELEAAKGAIGQGKEDNGCSQGGVWISFLWGLFKHRLQGGLVETEGLEHVGLHPFFGRDAVLKRDRRCMPIIGLAGGISRDGMHGQKKTKD